jgi:hypothetical protein
VARSIVGGAAILAISSNLALAQRANLGFPVTNGDISSMVLSGQTLYLGGDITSIGSYTGGGVPVDSASGAARAGFPIINGPVTAVTTDGQGGWFVAGPFDSVGGVARQGLAQIRSNLTVSPWNPGIGGYVGALTLSNGILYVGGSFSSVGGQLRGGLAAIDAVGGAVTPWIPQVSSHGVVNAIVVRGDTVFVGGDFDAIGTQPRNSLAALSATTGSVLPWNPDVFFCGGIGGCSRGAVYCLALSGDVIYAGGNFPFVGGAGRTNIAALSTSTGEATEWNPGVNGNVQTIAVGAGTVYVGGLFYAVGGGTGNLAVRMGVAALDSATGAPTEWRPLIRGPLGAYGGGVRSLVLAGPTVYIGGYFTAVGATPRSNLAAIDATTGSETSWSPSGFAPVSSLSVGGGVVFAGALSTNVGGVERHHVAAVDLATGQPTAWNPDADAPVRVLAAIGGTLYAGGEFVRIGGQARNRLAALDVVTGVATGWNPDADAEVLALATVGGTLYAGGSFLTIGGQLRPNVAALDLTTGLATTWNPGGTGGTGSIRALALSGGQVFVGGDFVRIGGLTRYGVAAIDAITGMVKPWDTGFCDGPVYTLLAKDSLLHVGGGFSTIAGAVRGGVAALDVTTAAPSSLNPLSVASTWALREGQGVLYLGGIGTYRQGGLLNGIGAISTLTGGRIAWEPDLNEAARAIAVAGGTVYAGGGFTLAAGRPRAYLAALPAATAPAPPGPSTSINLLVPMPNPLRENGTIVFQLSQSDYVWLDVFDLSGRPVRHLLEGALYPAGTHTVPITIQGLRPGLHFVDLRAAGERATHRLAVVP